MSRRDYGGGSIRERGQGRYQLRWSEGVDPFTGDNIRRTETITAKTLTEARRQLAARIAGKRDVSRMTVGQLIDHTIDELEISEATRDRYRYALVHVPPIARSWVAQDVTKPQARLVIEGLTERHGPQTVRKCYTALMSCWKQADRNGWVTSNPWRGQRLPKVNRSAGVVARPDEVRALIDAAEPGVEACWLRIHLATGARPGEVVGLRWSSFDRSDSTLTMIDAKHGGIDRPVALDVRTVDIVDDWQTEQARYAEDNGFELVDDPWLITSEPDASRGWNRSYAGGFRWRSLRDRAGVRSELRLYDLRHTSNSLLAAAGVSSADRAARIGNSPATNERVYTHPTADREAAAAIGELLG